MMSKRFLLVLLIAALAITLSACRRAASTMPPATPTTSSGFPVPGTETMGLFETIATQTALAAQGVQTTVQPLTPTEVPVAEKPTKAPKATKTPAAPEAVATEAPTEEPAQPTATLAAIVVPTATPGLPATYTMHQGEYPYCIARRFNVNPNELLSSNGLTGNELLYDGLTLNIPQTGNPFPGTRSLHDHPATYTVKANDSIYSVACYFGDVDPLVLAQVNNLQKPYTLTAGQVLQVP